MGSRAQVCHCYLHHDISLFRKYSGLLILYIVAHSFDLDVLGALYLVLFAEANLIAADLLWLSHSSKRCCCCCNHARTCWSHAQHWAIKSCWWSKQWWKKSRSSVSTSIGFYLFTFYKEQCCNSRKRYHYPHVLDILQPYHPYHVFYFLSKKSICITLLLCEKGIMIMLLERLPKSCV